MEGRPRRVSTAGGIITVDQVEETRIPMLYEHLNAYVLPSTPNALSLGKLCADQGFTFDWDGLLENRACGTTLVGKYRCSARTSFPSSRTQMTTLRCPDHPMLKILGAEEAHETAHTTTCHRRQHHGACQADSGTHQDTDQTTTLMRTIRRTTSSVKANPATKTIRSEV